MIRLEYLIKSRPEGFGAADPRLLAVRVGPKESKASALLFPQGRRLEFQDAQRTTETSERERERKKERERDEDGDGDRGTSAQEPLSPNVCASMTQASLRYVFLRLEPYGTSSKPWQYDLFAASM